MSEVIKYKYTPYIAKIQKILVAKFEQRTPIEYCVSHFFICFYNTWKEFTAIVAERLKKSDYYTLGFLWYTSHRLLSEPNSAKLQQFMEFLTTNFEDPLRFFDP
jgi:hypothetical protein